MVPFLICLWMIIACVRASSLHYVFNLTWESRTPDGFRRDIILVNGQFPGPELFLGQGDDVEITVQNFLPFNVTIHWHGIHQIATPWSDGVPGLSQWPIRPGANFIYRWNAINSGSFWYHAHVKGLSEDGLYGAIYIRPSDDVERPFTSITNDSRVLNAMLEAERNTKSLIISDWRHFTSEEIWNIEASGGIDTYCVDSILINGVGSRSCLSPDVLDEFASPALKKALVNGLHLSDTGCVPPNPVSQGFSYNLSSVPTGVFNGCIPSAGQTTTTLQVDPENNYASFDVVSTAGNNILAFSIDQHPMTVYAADGIYVKPVTVDALYIANGQRYSVLVRLDQEPSQYPIRIAVDSGVQILNGTAVMEYSNTSPGEGPIKETTPYITIGGISATDETVFLDENRLVPYDSIGPAADADETHIVVLQRVGANYRWMLGKISTPISVEQESPPMLFDPDSIDAKSDLAIRTHAGAWVDIVLVVDPAPQPSHSIHKHGSDFFVLGRGNGHWNYSTVVEAMKYIPEAFNLRNPTRRDTTTTLAAINGPTWMVLRYHVKNPGCFPIHCHTNVHKEGGMTLAILDGVEKFPKIPDYYLKHY